VERAGVAPLITRSRQAQARLLADAQRHGLARTELTAEDVAVTAWSLQGVLDVTRGLPGTAWERHLESCSPDFGRQNSPCASPRSAPMRWTR
jgi:hypothetical protein